MQLRDGNQINVFCNVLVFKILGGLAAVGTIGVGKLYDLVLPRTYYDGLIQRDVFYFPA